MIDAHILSQSSHPGMTELLTSRENYFASTAVFVSPEDITAIQSQIYAIEKAVKLPAFQSAIYARGYNGAYDVQTETDGVFMGYDFHMTPDGPRLIEINSNAGGAFIVNTLEEAIGKKGAYTPEKIGQMFLSEWEKSGRAGRPKTIAIIDETPEEQFHYPDMCLAADLLHKQGFHVMISDPSRLRFEKERLWITDTQIDIVYNRLTDFTLTGPYSASLTQALTADAAVITPNPRHHAIFADKRNLALLSNPDLIKSWRLADHEKTALAHIPETIIVTAANADKLWTARKQYFFKPYGGFGSRGVYKGAKLTTRVWTEIKKGGYIAQRFIAPPVRAVGQNDDITELKFDIRAYSYGGDILLLAARMYQGQTTNLRTSGGGLAPVVTLNADFDICTSI